MSKNDSSFAVHVWRRIAGEERLLGLPVPQGSPDWMAAVPGLIRAQVAHGASRGEALGNLVLALATTRSGLAPAMRILDHRMLTYTDDKRIGTRPATDAEVLRALDPLPAG